MIPVVARDDHCEILCLDLEKAEVLRSGRLSAAEAGRVAGQAKALADPTRLTLSASLAEGGELPRTSSRIISACCARRGS